MERLLSVTVISMILPFVTRKPVLLAPDGLIGNCCSVLGDGSKFLIPKFSLRCCYS